MFGVTRFVIVRSGFYLLFVAIGLGPVCEAVAAQGIKSKIKNVMGRGDKSDPRIEMPDSTSQQVPSESSDGMRHVLLISEPKHGNEFARLWHDLSQPGDPGAGRAESDRTFAFVEFNHIGHRLFPERESDVCAAQVAAALAQHLSDLNIFKVVTREHIASVLEEIDFSNSGSVDSTSSARLGNLIGAGYLIYGQVQLCLSSKDSFEKLANSAQEMGESALDVVGVKGKAGSVAKTLMGAAKGFKPEKQRSFVLAQIRIIEAQTGKQIFTTSLRGNFNNMKGAMAADLSRRELIANAANDLANSFIDDFLSRPQPRYIEMYRHASMDFDQGIDLVQLGDCVAAERHFRAEYSRNKNRLNNPEIAKLMYNHGISLMCANRQAEAVDRLWASLRLTNHEATFNAIEFTYDTVDRGRRIVSEEDRIIRDVRGKMYPLSQAGPSPSASGSAGSPH